MAARVCPTYLVYLRKTLSLKSDRFSTLVGSGAVNKTRGAGFRLFRDFAHPASNAGQRLQSLLVIHHIES